MKAEEGADCNFAPCSSFPPPQERTFHHHTGDDLCFPVCASTSRAAEAGQAVCSSSGLERLPQIAVLAGVSQIMLICYLWLAFCCSFSSQPSSARCVPWRRRGAHPATAGSRTGAFPWAGKSQAQGYLGEQRADSYTCIPNPPGGGFFKACPVPFEQIEG